MYGVFSLVILFSVVCGYLPKAYVWYDFTERSAQEYYHDVFSRGPTTKGGLKDNYGIRVNEENRWGSWKNEHFEIVLPNVSNFTIVAGFLLGNPSKAELLILSSNETSLLTLRQDNANLCFEFYNPYRVNCIASEFNSRGYALAVKDNETDNTTDCCALTTGSPHCIKFSFMAKKTLKVRFQIITEATLSYYGILDGPLDPDSYNRYFAPLFAQKRSCSGCLLSDSLLCPRFAMAQPLLTDPGVYRCPCWIGEGYDANRGGCVPLSTSGCHYSCKEFCSSQAPERCLTCRYPFSPSISTGDFFTCRCNEGKGYNLTTDTCERLATDLCHFGCKDSCSAEYRDHCFLSCGTGFESSSANGDFVTCKCPKGSAFRASENKCVQTSGQCSKKCNGLCLQDYPEMCVSTCASNLTILMKDGEIGKCDCPLNQGYEESSNTCQALVPKCAKGCQTCSLNNAAKCYLSCKSSFVSTNSDGDFLTCSCPNGELYSSNNHKCIKVASANCGYECSKACQENATYYCANRCASTFLPQVFDGDFFTCGCEENYAGKESLKACVPVKYDGCASSCKYGCDDVNSDLCLHTCKETYAKMRTDGEFVTCRCPFGYAVSEETGLCIYSSISGGAIAAIVFVVVCSLIIVGGILFFVKKYRDSRPKQEQDIFGEAATPGTLLNQNQSPLEEKAPKKKEEVVRELGDLNEQEAIKQGDLNAEKEKIEKLTKELDDIDKQTGDNDKELNKLKEDNNKKVSEVARTRVAKETSLKHSEARLKEVQRGVEEASKLYEERKREVEAQAAQIQKAMADSQIDELALSNVPKCCHCMKKVAWGFNDCGHKMCEDCFDSLIGAGKPCPICNALLVKKKLF